MRITSLILAALVLLTSCKSQDKPNQEMPAVPVIAAAPTIKDVTVYIEAVGTLHPAIHMEIRPQVSGTIDKTFVQEGQSIQEGLALFQIDPALYKIKVRQAQAQLSIDEANLQAAQKKLERFRGLAQKDLISQTEWDELEAVVAKAKASIDYDEAQLSAAKLDLEHCTVRSPTAGRIGKLDIHPGLLVSSGQILATVAKMDPMIIEFAITEKEHANIVSWNLPIEMTSLCSGSSCKKGSITFLDNHFDIKNGLLLIRGSIANSDYSLRPGQSVRVRVPVTVTPKATLLPQKSIRYNQEGPYVYVVQADNSVALRQLTLGAEEGSDQIVLKGIEPTEVVIIDGHLRLFPGAKVEVKS